VQEFRYVTEAEALAEKARRDAELKGKRAGNSAATVETQASKQEPGVKPKDSAPQ